MLSALRRALVPLLCSLMLLGSASAATASEQLNAPSPEAAAEPVGTVTVSALVVTATPAGAHVSFHFEQSSESSTVMLRVLPGDAPYDSSSAVAAASVEKELTLTGASGDRSAELAFARTADSRVMLFTKGVDAALTYAAGDAVPALLPGTASVSGTATVGETLTAVPGQWPEGASLTYQWYSGSEPIPGATAQTLVLVPALSGASVSVIVTGTLTPWVSTATSDPVTVSPGSLPSAIPSIAGVAVVGQALEVRPGDWAPGASLQYQWLADGSPIVGQTAPTMTLTKAHASQRISVRVTATLAGYTDAVAEAAATQKVASPVAPTVSGTPVVGSVLTANPGTWGQGQTYTYQWSADGQPITQATGKTFTVTSYQDSRRITVEVTGTAAGVQTTSRSSSPTALVMRWSVPMITGTVAHGLRLTAVRGLWSPGTAFSYQWRANGYAITGATSSTFTPGVYQKDKRISVTVTGRKTGSPTVAKTSASTLKVNTVAVPTVSGTTAYGKTVYAKPGVWGTGTTFTYRWFADGAPVATGSKLVLGSTVVGKRLTVAVTGKRSGYATVTRTSRAYGVARASTPSIVGTPVVNNTLSARPNTWTPSTTFRYQWYANGYAMSGATSASLRVSTALAGKRLTVRVTGSRTGFPTLAMLSTATSAVTYPSRTQPVDSWTCPSWAPIKGNASSMIYHVPGGSFYNRTNPEECFRTESAAVAAGYRRSLR